ncbi:histidine--tRNA ligase [Thermoleophilia bacterium SCSIO 60948]|nr:histidine--tRNA ligase [Thermoleophilia bacterium SCSIO 60948]
MAERLKAPRGTFDILPDSSRRRARVERMARDLFDRAGFGRIETPAFEETEVFARGVGGSTDIVRKEMYSFADKGGRELTLRPEGTAAICRAFVEHGMSRQALPVKLWYLGPFFRHERPQAGRYRQFWQIGAETIGSDSPLVDAESIALLHDLLSGLGVPDVRLRLGSLGSPATRAEYRAELIAHLEARESELSSDVRERYRENPLRAFDADDPGTRAVMDSAPRLLDRLSDEDAEHFAAVRRLLDDIGVVYEIDPTLVRGLDYYTRTVFEFTCDALGAQSGVGGGGRYDGLVAELGGNETPAVGWAVGVERILLALGEEDPASQRDVFIASADEQRERAFALATELRAAGFAADVDLAGRAFKGQMKQADRLGARHVVILDDAPARIRDMRSGEERQVGLDRIAAELSRPDLDSAPAQTPSDDGSR